MENNIAVSDSFAVIDMDEMNRITVPDWIKEYFPNSGAIGLIENDGVLRIVSESEIEKQDEAHWVRPLDENDRIVIPQSYCKKYGLTEHRTLMLEKNINGELILHKFQFNKQLHYKDILSIMEIRYGINQGYKCYFDLKEKVLADADQSVGKDSIKHAMLILLEIEIIIAKLVRDVLICVDKDKQNAAMADIMMLSIDLAGTEKRTV